MAPKMNVPRKELQAEFLKLAERQECRLTLVLLSPLVPSPTGHDPQQSATDGYSAEVTLSSKRSMSG